MDFDKLLQELVSDVGWKVIVGTLAGLAGFVLSLKTLKIYAYFIFVLIAALGLLWHLEWVIFLSITDLALAALIIYSLNTLSVLLSKGSMFLGLVLNALVFIFVLWLLPGMTSKSPLIAAGIYTAIASGFALVALSILDTSTAVEREEEYF